MYIPEHIYFLFEATKKISYWSRSAPIGNLFPIGRIMVGREFFVAPLAFAQPVPNLPDEFYLPAILVLKPRQPVWIRCNYDQRSFRLLPDKHFDLPEFSYADVYS